MLTLALTLALTLTLALALTLTLTLPQVQAVCFRLEEEDGAGLTPGTDTLCVVGSSVE